MEKDNKWTSIRGLKRKEKTAGNSFRTTATRRGKRGQGWQVIETGKECLSGLRRRPVQCLCSRIWALWGWACNQPPCQPEAVTNRLVKPEALGAPELVVTLRTFRLLLLNSRKSLWSISTGWYELRGRRKKWWKWLECAPIISNNAYILCHFISSNFI